jgi:hypothetical protein
MDSGGTSWPDSDRDIDAYFPSDMKSIQVNLGSNGHAGAQLIQVPLIRMEAYPYRESLNYLHVVTRRILGRKQAGSISRGGGHILDLAIKRFAE